MIRVSAFSQACAQAAADRWVRESLEQLRIATARGSGPCIAAAEHSLQEAKKAAQDLLQAAQGTGQ